MQRLGRPFGNLAARIGTRAFLLSLLAVWAVGVLSLLVAAVRSGAPWTPNLPPSLGIFARWDSHWYYQIAVSGYFRREAYVFMPLYPLLMHLMHTAVRLPNMLGGLLLSWAADLCALILLVRLWIEEAGEEFAKRSIWLLLAFPAAFFLVAAYSESLYLLLSVAAFLAMRHGRFPLAAVLAAFAAVSRTNGFFLIVPFLAYAWEASDRKFDRRFFGRAAWSLLPIAALGVYALYSQIHIGNALAFLTMQSDWHRHYTGATFAFSYALAHILHGQGALLAILDYLTPAAFLLILVLDQGRMRIGDTLYVALGVLTTLVAPAIPSSFVLMSATRLCMPYFPVYLAAARVLQRPGARRWITAAMALGQATLWITYAHWWFAG